LSDISKPKVAQSHVCAPLVYVFFSHGNKTSLSYTHLGGVLILQGNLTSCQLVSVMFEMNAVENDVSW